MTVTPFTHNTINLSTGEESQPTTVIEAPSDQILTREQIDWIFDQLGVGYVIRADSGCVVRYEDGTLSSPGYTFTSIPNNQDIRVLLPYSVTGASQAGYLSFTLYEDSEDLLVQQAADGPYIDDVYFGATGSAFAKLFQFEGIDFYNIRNANDRLPLPNTLVLKRTYVPITAWDIGRLNGSTLPLITTAWTGVEGAEQFVAGPKNITPYAFQRPLPITWYLNDAKLTYVVSNNLPLVVYYISNNRSVDAIGLNGTANIHNKSIKADIRVYDNESLNMYTNSSKTFCTGIVGLDTTNSRLRTPSSFYSKWAPIRVSPTFRAKGLTGWMTSSVPQFRVIKDNIDAGAWSGYTPFSITMNETQATAEMKSRFDTPSDYPNVSGQTMTMETNSQTFKSLHWSSRDDKTALQPTYTAYTLTPSTAAFNTITSTADTQGCMVFASEMIDGAFTICFKIHVTGIAYVSLTEIPWESFGTFSSPDIPYRPYTSDAHERWRNNGVSGWWAACGISIDRLNNEIGLYQNYKPATFYTIDPAKVSYSDYWIAFRRSGDGVIDRFVSPLEPGSLSDMTKLIDGAVSVLATPLAGAIRPMIINAVRPIFYLNNAGQSITNTTALANDNTTDPQLISVFTNNSAGMYTCGGDAVTVSHQGTPRMCSILGQYGMSAAVYGTPNLCSLTLLTPTTLARAVVRFLSFDLNTVITTNEYVIDLFGIATGNVWADKVQIALRLNETKVNPADMAVTITDLGGGWTATSAFAGNFLNVTLTRASSLPVYPDRDGMIKLVKLKFSGISAHLAVAGTDAIWLNLSTITYYKRSALDPSTFIESAPTTYLEEALYSDFREGHRVSFSIAGLRAIQYDYGQPEYYTSQPACVYSWVLSNGTPTTGQTAGEELYFRVSFTTGAPMVTDIGNVYRLTSDMLEVNYGSGSGHLRIGPTWRVAPGYTESDGIYDIRISTDSYSGDIDATIRLLPTCCSPAGQQIGSTVYASYQKVGPFNPATDTTLIAWYDPSDLTTIALNDTGSGVVSIGDGVGMLRNKKQDLYHLTQSDSSSRPQLAINAGATAGTWLRFYKQPNRKILSIPPTTDLLNRAQRTIAFVAKQGYSSAPNLAPYTNVGSSIQGLMMCAAGGASPWISYYIPIDAVGALYGNGNNQSYVSKIASRADVMDDKAHVFQMTYDWGATPRIGQGYFDGVLGIPGTNLAAGQSTAKGFQIGGDQNDASRAFEGWIGEMLVFDSYKSKPQLDKIREYLRTKWNSE